jgi:Domain of unknown function (DUF6265)
MSRFSKTARDGHVSLVAGGLEMLKQVAVAALVAGAVVPFHVHMQGPGINQVGWLSGCWAVTRPDGVTEEHWMKPLGGSMLGMSRTVRGGKTTEHEFLQIREANGQLAYIAKPSGQAEATFPAKTVGDAEVVFENLKHDFPHRIIYRKTADGITARVEGVRNGKPQEFDLAFKKCG